MKKLTLLTGFAAGYVLGARAGRERYEQIKAGATRFAQNPQVRAAATKAQDTVAEQAATAADAAKEKVSDVASTAADKVRREASIQPAP